jgi:hypothetical protein
MLKSWFPNVSQEKSTKVSPSRSGEAVGSFQGLLIHQPEPGRSNKKPRRTWGYQYPLIQRDFMVI